MLRIWKYYRDTSLIVKLAAGFVLGLIVAAVFGSSASALSPLGELFLRLLQMIVIPLVVVTLIGAVNMGSPGSLARIGPKAILYYLSTTLVAVVIGLGAASLVDLGAGMSLPQEKIESPETTSAADVLLGIVPENIVSALANANMLSVIFVAIIVGLAISAMRHANDSVVSGRGEGLLNLVSGAKDVTYRILDGILQYAPVGVFGLAASTIGGQSLDAVVTLGTLIGTYYGSIAVHIALVYVLLLVLFRVNVLRFFKNSSEALVTGFTTGSSSGTLPVALKCARKAGLAENVSGFVLPLGATVNMDGAALRLGAYAVLAANVVDKDLSFTAMAGLVLTATLVSIGAAGIPGAGPVVLSIMLTQAGLPLEVVGIVAGVDILLNSVSTMCNVTGDMVGAHIIDKTENRRQGKDGTSSTAGSASQKAIDYGPPSPGNV